MSKYMHICTCHVCWCAYVYNPYKHRAYRQRNGMRCLYACTRTGEERVHVYARMPSARVRSGELVLTECSSRAQGALSERQQDQRTGCGRV